MPDWYTEARNTIRQALADAEIPAHRATNALNMIDFYQRHNATTSDGHAQLWGFGTAPVLFERLDGAGGWWIRLRDLVKPLGISVETLEAAWHEDRQEYDEDPPEDGRPTIYRADEIVIHKGRGEIITVKIVDHTFSMKVLMDHSPWAREFLLNSQDLMSRALMEVGLAAKFTATNGKTLHEILVDENLPSLEVARHQAFSGPRGGLDRLTNPEQ